MKKLLRKSRQTKFDGRSKEDERRGGLGSGVGRVDMRCPSLKEWGRDIGMRCPSYRSGETSPVSRSHYQKSFNEA